MIGISWRGPPRIAPSFVEIHILMAGRPAMLSGADDTAKCTECSQAISGAVFPIIAVIVQLRGDRAPPHGLALCRECAPTMREARLCAGTIARSKWPALPAVLADRVTP